MRVNERISSFLGLNDLLDPASAEYREGMAWSCTNARINNKGLWTGKPTTSGSVSATQALAGGTGQRQMTIGGVSKLITGIGCAAEGQNGYIYYLNGGVLYASTGGTVTQADVAAPTLVSAAAGTGSSLCRIATGLYYYIVTDYNPTINRESLPSIAIEVDFDSTSNTKVTITTSALVSGRTRRVYRSKGTDAENFYFNAPNRFYYIGEISSGTTYDDYRNDEELLVEYEGRGTVFTSPDFIVSYNDRMLYLKSNVLWWSSSGRPEEVAQKYNVDFYSGANHQLMPSYPKLTNGYGEAKKEISELVGQTIKGAIEKDGKLWLFTDSLMGYLSEVYGGEGYIFKVFRRGIGILNQFCLQSCEYGIFGFDGRGMWLLDNSNRITRLTDNRVDLSSFYGQTYYTGIWCPNLNEYWMCNGTTAVAYQADRDIFVGPYTISITAGCCWYDSAGSWGLIGTGKIVEGTGAVDLTFYLGQSSPTTVKQRITVEAVQAGNGTLAIKVTPLPRKNTAGLTVSPVERVVYGSSGDTAVRCTADTTARMIKAQVQLNSSASGGISTINYRYEPIEWTDTDGR